MNILTLLADPHAWAALITLSVLEIVLGIDNVIFISVLVSRLPAEKAKRARQIGLSLALIFRIVLLGALTWLMQLTQPLVTVFGMEISWRDIILIGGGLFLIAKATHEIHAEVEAQDEAAEGAVSPNSAFLWVVSQLILIDLVFSLDSIITAIGMAQDIEIMVAAVVIAIIVMYAASGPLSRFIADHPTTKMLALAFLLLIGVALVADGFEFHIPRGYIYSAMAFAAGVEVINVLARRNRRKRATMRSRVPKREPTP
jgi:predicted tellurium resistance membrane protein TerC